jgi:basic membrane protein A
LLVVLLGLGVVLTAGSGGSGSASAQQKKRIAYLSVGQVTVGTYEITHYTAFQKMVQKYGFEGTPVEKVDYSKAPELMRTLAAQGAAMIIVNSGGFAAALDEVAPEFPKTWFVGTSDIRPPDRHKNVAGFSPDWNEIGYLVGTGAGLATKTNKVGVISGVPIMSVNRVIGSLIHAAKTVNANVKVEVRYTQSWVDNARSKEAAQALIAEGVDILVPYNGSADAGVLEAVKEKNVKMVANYADGYHLGPKHVFTSGVVHADRMYDILGDLFSTSRLEPKIYVMDIAKGIVDFGPTRGLVPDSVERKMAEAREAIKAGRIKVDRLVYTPK